MANEDHLAILRKGVKAWNQWRFDNAELRPDLRGADLSATLRGATLHGATLHGATLRVANLHGADLRGADLSVANLTEADLSGADLSVADIGGATIGSTIFGNTDLSKLKGIDTVVHLGPSTIGVDTLYKSGAGNIPEKFLLGAGIPPDFIDYLPPSLRGDPIQFYSCFISYSSKDDEFAQRLHADLQAAKVRVWFAPEDMKTGDRIRDRIDESIRLYDKLLIVLSEASVNSDWVENEVKPLSKKSRTSRVRTTSDPPCYSPSAPTAPPKNPASPGSVKSDASVTSATSPPGKTTTATRRHSIGCCAT